MERSRVAFLVLLFFLLIGFGVMMGDFLEPAGLALVGAVMLRPWQIRMERWLRGRRYVAAGCAVLLALGLVLLPLGGMIARIVVELVRFSQGLGEYLHQGQLAQSIDALEAWLLAHVPLQGVLGDGWSLRPSLIAASAQLGHSLYQFSPHIVLSTASFGAHVILWMIFLFVFCADGPQLYQLFVDLLPFERRHERHIASEVRGMITAVFLGMLATSAMNALLMWIAFAVCRLPNAFLWGLITFGFSFVPVVGAFSIWCGGALYLLLLGKWATALGLAMFGIVIIAQADNIVKPLVMRGAVKIHPILLLLGILGGLRSLGPTGLIFGPVFIAILTAALQIYRQEYLLDNQAGATASVPGAPHD